METVYNHMTEIHVQHTHKRIYWLLLFVATIFEGQLHKETAHSDASTHCIALYPGRVGGERQPGIDCLHMRNHSQKNLGIRLRLEIVGKINMYTSDIFLYHPKIQLFASCITFEQLHECRG